MLMCINSKEVDKEFHDFLMHNEALKVMRCRPDPVVVKTKDGQEVRKLINEQENQEQSAKLENIVSKDTADEIFQGAIFHEKVHIMQYENVQNKIKIKGIEYSLKRQKEKLNLILNFRAVKGVLYILILLEEFKLSKDLFLHELEQG